MVKYALKRMLLLIPMLILVIFVVFFILNITPGNPGQIILGQNARPEAIEALNESLGVNKPLMERFFNYLWNVLHLDFGTSYRTGAPVFQDILIKFPVTLKLAIYSIMLSTIVGIPVGIISAVKEYSVLDYSLTFSSLFLASMPSFFLAMVLILFFSLFLGILPSTGMGTPAHYILPVVTLMLPTAAYFSRFTRTSMLETMREDYICTAKAVGASPRQIIIKHALKPTLLPVVTILGMYFAGLLGGAIITEVVFGLPGIGNLVLTAVKTKDAPTVEAATVFLAVLYQVIMFVVDILQAAIDPRLNAKLD